MTSNPDDEYFSQFPATVSGWENAYACSPLHEADFRDKGYLDALKYTPR
jgi:hypothetical protein